MLDFKRKAVFLTSNRHQRGINMVDLMMWLVIAALLLAAALQGISYYQKGAFLYQLKTNANDAGSNVVAASVFSGGNVTVDTAEKGLEITTWTRDVAGAAESFSSGDAYLRVTHAGLTEHDALYLFDDCGEGYDQGVNIVPKGDSLAVGDCGSTATTITPTSGVTPAFSQGSCSDLVFTYLRANASYIYADRDPDWSLIYWSKAAGTPVDEEKYAEMSANVDALQAANNAAGQAVVDDGAAYDELTARMNHADVADAKTAHQNATYALNDVDGPGNVTNGEWNDPAIVDAAYLDFHQTGEAFLGGMCQVTV